MDQRDPGSNFFSVSTYDEQYWITYIALRPKYSPDFYALVYDYHRAHGPNSFAVAHDIGTGPGQVAAELTTQFGKVIASDNNATHLAIAQHRLSQLHDDGKVTFIQASAEDIASKYPAQSSDLIVAAECIPLMDADEAVASFASLLRPRGTLAIWFYGRPSFAEDAYALLCQPPLDKILTKMYSKIINVHAASRMAWKRGSDCLASFLDDVSLPGEKWEFVERYKWNADKKMLFYDDEACEFKVERTSRVGNGEKVTEKIDRGFWMQKWDLDGVRQFVSVLMPGFKELSKEVDEEIEHWYRELGEAMGGEDAAREITWPVVLILATRK